VGVALHVDDFTDAGGTIGVRVPGTDVAAEVLVDGRWVEVGTARTTDDGVDLTADGICRRYRVRLSPHGAAVSGPEGQSSFTRPAEDDPAAAAGTAGECRAPLPGAITNVAVRVGDHVRDGDSLVVLEAMKMEHTLRAGGPGTIGAVLCAPGDQVDVGDLLVVVEPE
jgi:biotin carboxyl carrier protein